MEIGRWAGSALSREGEDNVSAELENRELWQQFHAEATEMIITKLGRRMFPSLELKISGLNGEARFCVLVEVAPASSRRLKYTGDGSRGWTAAGPAEAQPSFERRLYIHPDSPATGSHWMRQPVSFSKLKLTNNALEHRNNVVLMSMHKYIPRIWIIRCEDVRSIGNLASHSTNCFTFEETAFVAVTAYQNEKITKLKIEHNPFAKGFRESGQSRCKRKLSDTDRPFTGNHEQAADDENPQVRPRLHRPWTCSPTLRIHPPASASAPAPHGQRWYAHLTGFTIFHPGFFP